LHHWGKPVEHQSICFLLNEDKGLNMPNILIVGVTGMLGSKIASAILDKGTMTVRALVRSNNSKQDQLKLLQQRGMTFVEGDLLNPSSLLQACENVDAIVSAVSGDEQLTVTGQLNLIEAAAAQGVQRMIPSDYAVDYRKLDWGDNYNLDMRKKVFAALESSPLDYTLMLNGCFTDILFGSFLNIFDFAAGTFNYWGDGNTPFDITTTDDTAKFIAEAIADPSMANTALQIAGDVITMKQLLATYQRVTGKTLIENHLGSVEDLTAWIEKTKATATSPYDYLPQQYLFTMVSGKGKLDKIANSQYPQIKLTPVQEYIRQAGL
jgi:nucleoside-diphosphate-sugar epimerase